MDRFGVRRGESDGVIAGFEGYGEVPDEDAAGAFTEAEDEVGTGWNGCGERDFAGAVEGAVADLVRIHVGLNGFAFSGREAVRVVGLEGFAGSSAGGKGRAGFAQDVV